MAATLIFPSHKRVFSYIFFFGFYVYIGLVVWQQSSILRVHDGSAQKKTKEEKGEREGERYIFIYNRLIERATTG